MAVKTITIDIEAYETLARYKRPGQSFSQVIKERLGSRRTGADLLRALKASPVRARTIDVLDQIVRGRRRDRPRRVKL